MKKTVSLLLAAVLLATLLAGCGNRTDKTVSVQSVAMLTGLGSVGLYDRYAGVVEAGSTVAVEKDEGLAVRELYVSVGDTVKTGDVLFAYDTDALALELEKREVELGQLESSIETKTRQIATLEKEKATVSADAQIDYTIQIQELELDVSEAKLNVQAKQREIDRLTQLTEGAEVRAESDGRVLTINDPDSDSYDPSKPYLTLAATDSYRVKGTVNEQYAYDLYEGMPMLIRSRRDENVVWHGVVERVDRENPVQSGGEVYYYDGAVDEMSSSSKYPFYVTLEDDTDLMLGQHVFIEADVGQNGGLSLSADYLCDTDGDAYVWAAGAGDKLEKRSVTLGEYDAQSDSWEILAGLAPTDFIAFPDGSCSVGAPVVYYSEDSFGGDGQDGETFDGAYSEGGEDVYGENGEDVYGEDGAWDGDGEASDDAWASPAADGWDGGAVG